jgi:hypothetical protein
VSNVVASWTVRPASSVTIPDPSGWLYRKSPVLVTVFAATSSVLVQLPAYGIVFERSSVR